MAQYMIIIDKEDLHQIFNQDQGKAISPRSFSAAAGAANRPWYWL